MDFKSNASSIVLILVILFILFTMFKMPIIRFGEKIKNRSQAILNRIYNSIRPGGY